MERIRDMQPGESAWTEPSALWTDGREEYYLDADAPVSHMADERFRLRVESFVERMTFNLWHCPDDEINLIEDLPLPESAFPAIDITPNREHRRPKITRDE